MLSNQKHRIKEECDHLTVEEKEQNAEFARICAEMVEEEVEE